MPAPDAAPLPLKQTPLHALHLARGGKMVRFAGYDMPVQYAAGVLKEHLHTRTNAGLFDVSHMGQIALRPKYGKVEDAARALERLVPQDIVAIAPGRQRYAQFTNTEGGILDDLMVAHFGDHLFLVVNAACKAEDEALLRAQLSDSCIIEPLTDRALIALQGPKAAAVLARHCADAEAMRFMDAGPRKVMELDCFVSRSGYTGEDGFEISVPAADAEKLASALLADDAVAPIGLGARDSLRLEAGLCLYGHDIDTTTTPVEADLVWSIQKSRRSGGVRAGGFSGADKILAQIEGGAPPGAWVSSPKAAPRCATVRNCSPTRRPANRSAASPPAASDPASTGRSPWVICPRRMPPSAARSLLRSVASGCRSASRICLSFPTATSVED